MQYDYQEIGGVVRRLEMELAEAKRKISDLETTTQTLQDQPASQSQQPTPSIANRLRNTDHNHSVNTWFEATPSGDNKKDKECANIYTSEADTAIEITDGAITSGTNTLQCATSTPFNSGHVGARIIIYGAGSSGSNLVTTISGFTDSANVTLTLNAGTTVSNAKVRFNLQKLARVNSKNSGSSTNDALKDAAHTNYATNINDPDWDKASGVVRLGSTNTLNYFFGYYDTATGAVFTPQNPLFPGRVLYVIMNIARASQYVKIRGYLYVGLWNNEDSALEYLKGGGFQITGAVKNVPAATATTQYLIVAETDRGYTYVSEILTVANAPSLSSYIPNVVEVHLSWDSIPGGGDLRYTIYRKIDSGNVFNIAQVPNGSSRFVDNNPADRVDTGSTSFPSVSGFSNSLAFVATRSNELRNVPVGEWQFKQFSIPVVRSTNLQGVHEVIFRTGLTEPLATEVRDGVANNTDTMTSAAGVFILANHNGKSATVSDPADSSRVITTTVTDVPDANRIEFADVIPWSSSNNIIEIEDSYPNGLIIDLVGASLTQGIWSPHDEDDNRPQNVATDPNGSVYGGIGGDDRGGGGGDSGGGFGLEDPPIY